MYSFVSAHSRKNSRKKPHSVPLFLLLGGLTLAYLPLRAETVSFSGKVVDAAGTGIPWALIRLQGGDATVQSGLDGSFTLAGNVAAVFFYPDPEPGLPFAALAATPGLPDRYLLTGRVAS